mmetsp:Transcript_68476/g.155141  ORF Transcript_68476/g.155141 Transcript_68476/m.155141 type:complete len:259 (-) Transcript_68476:118-894(-)
MTGCGSWLCGPCLPRRPSASASSQREVQVVAQEREWRGLQDSDDEEDAQSRLRRRASAGHQAREQRLSVGADSLQETLSQGRPIVDTEVEVVPQSSEWRELEDPEEDVIQDQFQRHAGEALARREKRLTVGAEAINRALQQETLLGDADVQVVSQTHEWRGLEDSDEEAQGKVQFNRRASDAYSAREKRLSVGLEAIRRSREGSIIIVQEKEWAGAEDSDDEPVVEKLCSHAKTTHNARERRLTAGAEALKVLTGGKA